MPSCLELKPARSPTPPLFLHVVKNEVEGSSPASATCQLDLTVRSRLKSLYHDILNPSFLCSAIVAPPHPLRNGHTTERSCLRQLVDTTLIGEVPPGALAMGSRSLRSQQVTRH